MIKNLLMTAAGVVIGIIAYNFIAKAVPALGAPLSNYEEDLNP